MPKWRKTEIENPREALAWIKGHIRSDLEEYDAHKPPLPVTGVRYVQWLSDVRRLRWCAEVLETYGSGENKKDLERLLGLKAGPGRPSKPGKNFRVGLEMFSERSTKSPTRKSKKGELTPKLFKEIVGVLGLDLDDKAARKIVERELLHIVADRAKKLAAHLQKNSPIRKIPRIRKSPRK
jgi:hypothetical protein